VRVKLKSPHKFLKNRYPQIASQHQVQALPTLVLFKDGKTVDRLEGALPAEQLIDRIGKFL
jgi:thioredoxin-like negative regulator of GroEL